VVIPSAHLNQKLLGSIPSRFTFLYIFYEKLLFLNTNAINKINKVLDMKATSAEEKREEVLLKLIKQNYKSKTVKQYVMAM